MEPGCYKSPYKITLSLVIVVEVENYYIQLEFQSVYY